MRPAVAKGEVVAFVEDVASLARYFHVDHEQICRIEPVEVGELERRMCDRCRVRANSFQSDSVLYPNFLVH